MSESNIKTINIDPEEVTAWIRLNAISQIDTRIAHTLLSNFGLPQHIFDASYRDLLKLVPDIVARAIHSPIEDVLLKSIQKTLEWLNQPENHILTLSDHRYPVCLLDSPSPPLILFAKGNINLLNQKSIAISGAVHASEIGISDAREFAIALGKIGYVIVGGLTNGIEYAAHLGALDAKAGTIAVFSTGLDIVYPAQNLSLAHAIATNGCLISPFMLGTRFSPSNLELRSHLLSALSNGLLVIEAAVGSPTMSLAKSAISNGRDIFVIPGSIHNPLSRGGHSLIRQGAKLVETAKDISEEIK